MTKRTLPKIEALATAIPIDWEPPAEASNAWHPVKAATGDDARSINVFGTIGEDWDGTGVTERLVSAALRRMGAGPVTINVNSRGGDFFTGVAIYNLLREHDGEVTTRVLSLAASAASVIAMASDRLLVAKSAFLMIHNSHGVVIGNRNDMEAAAKVFAQFDGAMASLYADRSGMDRAKVEKMMDAETFLNGEEAVAKGFADGLLASDEVEEEDEPAAKAALRRLDVELAQNGMPRAERRALLKEAIEGTPRAAPNTTPGAGEFTALTKAIEILKRGSIQ